MKAVEEAVETDPTPPLPAVYEPQGWPLDARVWLYKAGISNAEIEALGFYWNPDLQRVVMPVYNSAGVPVYYQARTLDKTNPKKYLNPSVDKTRLIVRYGDGPATVLTEDMLSAYKVSRVGVAGLSLLGTTLNDNTLTELIRACKPVYVALDPDHAGRTAAAEIMRKLRAYNVTCVDAKFPRDPKLLNREEISACLNLNASKS
jgi:5S rRNA maturation endonuclease (ribonuclease M5)